MVETSSFVTPSGSDMNSNLIKATQTLTIQLYENIIVTISTLI